MNTYSNFLLALAISASVSTHAAQDGSVGNQSIGESELSFTKQNAVLISGLADLELGTHVSTTTLLSAIEAVCVFNSTVAYSITVTSSNNAFTLTNGQTGSIPYAMTWTDDTSVVSPLAYNTPLNGLQGDSDNTDCNGGTNASFAVSVAAADFNSADPGSYSDTLILTIEPE